MNDSEAVRRHYNENVADEWARIDGRPEFLLSCRFIDRYAKEGMRVLDIGGGPGRYSFHLVERGCDVTLLDLSDENVAFAAKHAAETGVKLQTVRGDARDADRLTSGLYDCVLLMGPLYHLLEENERIDAVNAALKCLKPGGVLFASFISVWGGLIYMTKLAPDVITSSVPMEVEFMRTMKEKVSYSGDAFTRAFFVQPREVLPFFENFPLEKLHLFGQEGVMTLNEDKIMSRPPETVNAMLDFSEAVCENPELYSWSEHLMYVGRKK